MFTEQEDRDYKRFVDTEYMCQSETAGEQAAFYGVKLCLSILGGIASHEALKERAYAFLHQFGNIEGLPLREETKHVLRVMAYGEEETEAFEERCKGKA